MVFDITHTSHYNVYRLCILLLLAIYHCYSPCSARYWHTLESKLHKNMHCFTQLVPRGHVQL